MLKETLAYLSRKALSLPFPQVQTSGSFSYFEVSVHANEVLKRSLTMEILTRYARAAIS